MPAGKTQEAREKKLMAEPEVERSFARAENEDDDGYDPYSDRPAPREPLFEGNPWG